MRKLMQSMIPPVHEEPDAKIKRINTRNLRLACWGTAFLYVFIFILGLSLWLGLVCTITVWGAAWYRSEASEEFKYTDSAYFHETRVLAGKAYGLGLLYLILLIGF